MAYVAAKGGEGAILRAEEFFAASLGDPAVRLAAGALAQTLPYLVDRVMGEASLYAPELAALALTQTGGDLAEAVLLLRAYRSTLPRLGFSRVADGDTMRVVRRISAAFRDIPGGQFLGPTLDYSHRLLRLDLLDETWPEERDGKPTFPDPAPSPAPVDAAPSGSALPFVADWLRSQQLAAPLPGTPDPEPGQIPDLTRQPLQFPAPRAIRLQALARADTGGVLTLGYANMRGYGAVHPTVNELRLAHTAVTGRHPVTGVEFTLGRIRTSLCEVVSSPLDQAGASQLRLGYCATLGWNELKILAGSMLDLAMDLPEPHPSHQEEFVLYHTEIVESSGFCLHYKLPHYVTFASELDRLRAVRRDAANAVPGAGQKDGQTEPGDPGDLMNQLNETGLPTRPSA